MFKISVCDWKNIWVLPFTVLALLRAWRYNSGTVLAFSKIPFHLRRSWTCSVHFMSFIFFKSFLTSTSHRDLGLPTGLLVNGFHSCIFFTILVSGNLQGGSNMTGTDLCVNKPHCAAAVRPWESEATTSTLPPARVRTCSVLSGSC